MNKFQLPQQRQTQNLINIFYHRQDVLLSYSARQRRGNRNNEKVCKMFKLLFKEQFYVLAFVGHLGVSPSGGS
jgi:hypothetical protein